MLEDNIGRSAVRNLLSEKAKYKWLLFLDSDVYPKKSNFINEYLDIIKRSEYAIISGGISYKIDNSKKLLRWKLGKNNEEKSVFIRSRNSYKYFFTANFLIKKSIMELINFNEDLIKYGYEDLLFSKSIKNKSIILIDDSLVRGTTCHKIVKMLYEAGAKDVHVRIACPEIKFPDFYGVDMPTKKELLAYQKNNDD